MALCEESCEQIAVTSVEGWLNVWEMDSQMELRLFEDGRTPKPIWEPHYCVLRLDKRTLTHYRAEKQADDGETRRNNRMRLDGSKRDFDKRWGYKCLESIKENVSQHSNLASLEKFAKSQQPTEKPSSGSPNSSYDRAILGDRRGSVPAVPSAVEEESMEVPSTPARIASFFSRKVRNSNLKRTKSVTKLDRKRTGFGGDNDGDLKQKESVLKRSMSLGRITRKRLMKNQGAEPHDGQLGEAAKLASMLMNQRIRASRSHESLLMTSSSMQTIDLSAADIEIKPLHSSILGQDHCFQVSTSNGSKYYSCRTAEERQKWIQHLRKTVHPNQEQSRRTDNSLNLWILEAKHVPSKKKYFCELCLDKTLYARTSSKAKGDMLFWGEQFNFKNLPAVETVTVNLYREADKKKKKEKNVLIGNIQLPVGDISNRQVVERWYRCKSVVVGRSGKDSKGEIPLVRVKARYQTVQILPMDMYQELIKYVQSDYCSLVDVLEPLISIKAKQEIATALVHILQKLNHAQKFLSDIVMQEVHKLDNENLAFRGNSIATKAMEAYLKLVGEKYLQDTLGNFIRNVIESGEDCEVDPPKVSSNSTLQKHQDNLVHYCKLAWDKIIKSHQVFPSELRDVFCSLKQRCQENKRADLSDNLISACLFLRFLCPAILSPSLFNLTQEFPDEKAARNLTLIAKTIQSLANFAKFGGKEEFMVYMNDFVEKEMANMRNFIHQISSESKKDPSLEFDGFIDLGKELSILHSLLVESIDKINDGSNVNLGGLKTILSDITEAKKNPRAGLKQTLNNLNIYDNMKPEKPKAADNNANMTRLNLLKDPPQKKDTAPFLKKRAASSPRLTKGVWDHHSQENFVNVTTISNAVQQNLGPYVHSTPNPRLDEQVVNQNWSNIVTAADAITGQGDYVDLIKFMDDTHNLSLEHDQVSVSQSVASSGYQSYGFSQTDSPTDTLKSDTAQVSVSQQPLSFSNPMFGQARFRQGSSSSQPSFCHSPSSGSLSSEEGARHFSSSQSYTADSARTVNHVHSRVSPGCTCAANSSESLDRRRKPITEICNSCRSPLEKQPQSHTAEVKFQVGPPQISRSTEYIQLSDHTREKSTASDGAPTSDKVVSPEDATRWNSLPAYSVRMGVSSVQMKRTDSEKNKAELEQELNRVYKHLVDSQAELEKTQQRLDVEILSRTNQEDEWRRKLEVSEEKQRRQQREKDEQIKQYKQRLRATEAERQRCQMEMQGVYLKKQKVIDEQDRRILTLESANSRLLGALSQLRDRYQLQTRNGVASPGKSKLTLSDAEQLRSSSC